MDAKTHRTLELPAILERLAGYAAFSASKELARSLQPVSDLVEIQRRLAETAEARLLIDSVDGVTIGGAHDVRPFVKAAVRGEVLEPSDFLEIKDTLISARRLRRSFEKAGSYPLLSALVETLQPAEGLIDQISSILDEQGRLPDRASPALGSIRAEMRVAHDRLMAKLQNMISDSKVIPMLQEPIITQREGRFVIPLRSEFKGRIKAVVHDQSSSGATLFIEPLPVVELNNRVRELELAERDEIRRLLAQLSGYVADQAEVIERNVEVLAELDLAFAKARYAEMLDAHPPELVPFKPDSEGGPGSVLRLIQARHPLLDPAQVVPIDMVLGEGIYLLVITGPNTGGKTVALKTAGLLVIMAACGLHLPAESGSKMTPFESVYADIGDEQSIEQSLSTFSGHISNIIRILEHAGPRSLVLLDELGAGTDPVEGAALAQALLETFLARGVTTLVATHYSGLKVFAHNTSGVTNASVEFDVESLRPTYHLSIGLPGRSNALAIASRLGMGEDILEQARVTISPEALRTEALLEEIYAQRDQARAAREEAEEARKRAHQRELELNDRLEGIERERLDLLRSSQDGALQELGRLKEEIDGLRRKLAAAGLPLEAMEEIKFEAASLQDRLQEPAPRRTQRQVEEAEALRPGDRVYLDSINAEGIITNLSEDQAEVQVGRLRVRTSREELMSARGAKPEPAPAPSASRDGPLPSAVPPLELDLRGHNAQDALETLEHKLDAAYLTGMPYMRIIHGKGTGKLRQEIRAWLKGNRYTASFEAGSPAEGGEGVTVVHLRGH
jgi:DNA mismatch repair protein MutS2